MSIVVDDQAFVVGLSELFREQMKSYEIASLLPLAQRACEKRGLSPEYVAVEGYYTESAELGLFFRLIRTLQNAGIREQSAGSAQNEINELRRVLNSPAMGRVEKNDRILPRTTSPLGEALQILPNWSIDGLTRQAQQLVKKDDAGLLAVAAAAGNPVGLCAARESMALMADVELAEAQLPTFDWHVSEHVAEVAGRFISALARTTGILLPEPAAISCPLYGQAARDADLMGRCILVGTRPGDPTPYYHWYIDSQDGRAAVRDFWSSDIWTTAMLRTVPTNERPTIGARVGAPLSVTAPGEKTSSSFNSRDENRVRRGWFARLFQKP